MRKERMTKAAGDQEVGRELHALLEELIDEVMLGQADPELLLERWDSWKGRHSVGLLPAKLIDDFEDRLEEVREALTVRDTAAARRPLGRMAKLLEPYRPTQATSTIRATREPGMRDLVWFGPEGWTYAVSLMPGLEQGRQHVVFIREDGWVRQATVGGELSLLDVEDDDLVRLLAEAKGEG